MKNIHLLPTPNPSKVYSYKGNLFLTTESHLHSPSMEYQNIYITNSEEIKEGVDQWYLDTFLNNPRNSSGSQYAEKQDVIILTTDQDLIQDGVQAIDDEFLEWFVKNPSCEYIKTEKWLDDEGEVLYSRIIPKEEAKKVGEYQQELFSYLHDLGVIALQSEMQEIERIVLNMQQELERGITITHVGKQETLEEAFKKTYLGQRLFFDSNEGKSFEEGAKWQKEQCKKDLDAHLDVAEDLWLQVVKQNKKLYSEEEVLKLLLNSEEYTSRFNGRTDLKHWFEQFKKK